MSSEDPKKLASEAESLRKLAFFGEHYHQFKILSANKPEL